MRIVSPSPAKTRALGMLFGKELKKHKPATRGAFVIGLDGNLGSGKTTFMQGFGKGVGAQGRIVSPTFIIMRRHALRRPHTGSLVHMDVYRIKKVRELRPLRFEDMLKDPRNIIVVEWANRIKKALPKNTVWIKFIHGKSVRERKIYIGK